MIDEDQKAFDSERRRLAALAESTLKFRKTASDTLDELLIKLIGENASIGVSSFTTPGGRPCRIMIAVGEETSRAVNKFCENIIS